MLDAEPPSELDLAARFDRACQAGPLRAITPLLLRVVDNWYPKKRGVLLNSSLLDAYLRLRMDRGAAPCLIMATDYQIQQTLVESLKGLPPDRRPSENRAPSPCETEKRRVSKDFLDPVVLSGGVEQRSQQAETMGSAIWDRRWFIDPSSEEWRVAAAFQALNWQRQGLLPQGTSLRKPSLVHRQWELFRTAAELGCLNSQPDQTEDLSLRALYDPQTAVMLVNELLEHRMSEHEGSAGLILVIHANMLSDPRAIALINVANEAAAMRNWKCAEQVLLKYLRSSGDQASLRRDWLLDKADLFGVPNKDIIVLWKCNGVVDGEKLEKPGPDRDRYLESLDRDIAKRRAKKGRSRPARRPPPPDF